MAKKSKKGKRFMMLSDAAEELSADLAIVSRQVKAGTIEAVDKQIFINAGTEDDPEFYPVYKRKVRVIDLDKIEKVNIVKFRRKTA